MPEDIPKSLVELVRAVTPKAVSDFSELVSLKLFGKSLAKLRAEAENKFDEIKQVGEIRREVERPFIVEIETAKAHRQYSNLGETLKKATTFIKQPSGVMKDDNDVFWGLLEHSKEISNEEMQDLIAKIIAGEYNNPETYSMSTLQTLKFLGRKEIELFEQVCGLLLDQTKHLPMALFTGGDDTKPLMQKLDIDFEDFQTLQNLGLFLPNNMKNILKNPEKKNFAITYFDKKIIYTPQNENKLDIEIPGFYGLSLAGRQILGHLNPKYNEDYYNWLKENYKITNYEIII
jgi:hypothetical protein